MRPAILVMAVLWGLAGDGSVAAAAGAPDGVHQRARETLEAVISTREFRAMSDDEGMAIERLIEWFAGMFKGVGDSINALPAWMGWTIIAWLVVTLVAILGHMIYSLYMLCRGSGSTAGDKLSARGPGNAHGQALDIYGLTFESVHLEAQRLLSDSDWRGATRYFYMATILWLERQGRVTIERSKTNYDYLRDLKGDASISGRFQQLTGAFEQVAYGGASATSTSSHRIAADVEAMRHATGSD